MTIILMGRGEHIYTCICEDIVLQEQMLKQLRVST